MKKMELENLNSLLTTEVKSYANTLIPEVLYRIKTYKYVYKALGIEEEYHRTINEAYIPHLDIGFYEKEKLTSILELIEYHKAKIYENVLLDGLDNFTTYLTELIWDLVIDVEDKKKIEKSLNEI
jgi:hypothetical protein